jgi:hypothetical protein
MPVLTCPFATLPARTIPVAQVSYPQKILLTTELAIKPTATETWGVEGISLQFTAKYIARFFRDITASHKGLVEARKYLEKRPPLIKEQIEKYEFIRAKQLAKGEEIPAEESSIAIQGLVSEREGVLHEIETIEKEIVELLFSRSALEAGLATPPLIITARLYARGNELVWNNNLSSLRFSTFIQRAALEFKGRLTANAGAEWNEAFDDHVQFDDPIEFTERENLKLVLELDGPPPVVVKSGVEFELLQGGGLQIGEETGEGANVTLSGIQAIVNYSRQVAS